MIHALIEKINPSQLSTYFWWFTVFSIIIPIVGALIGGMFVLASVKVNDRITELTQQENEQRISRSETVATTANTKMLETQARLEEAKKGLEELKDTQAPRVISVQEQQAFLNFVASKPKGKVKIGSMPNDVEGYNFALQLSAMLSSSGFEVDKVIGVWQMSGKPFTGLRVSSASIKPPLYLWSIVDGLKSIGIESLPIADPYAEDGVIIVVGPKP